MTRLFYTAGAARIVVVQQNWLTHRKSTVGQSEGNAGIAGHARHGSDATEIPAERWGGLQTGGSVN